MLSIPSPFDSTTVAMSVDGLHVMIGIPCGPNLPWQTVQSLCETISQLKDRGIPYDITMVAGCSIVESARCRVADQFLKSKANRLFMIDSDIVWQSKDFIRLLAMSTQMDVICGAYPAKVDDLTFLMADNPGDRMILNDFGCLPISGTGLGFCIVTRAVMEKLARYAPLVKFGSDEKPIHHIFYCDSNDGVFKGEDIQFFEDVKTLGIDVFMDPSLSLGHVGAKCYSGSINSALKKV